MDKLFLTVLNMSLTGAFVIAGICLARLPLKKAPKIISYCLWAAAGFRLVCPFSIESAFSLIPFNTQLIPADIGLLTIPRIDSGTTAVNNAVNSLLPAAAPFVSANPLQIWTAIGAMIWLAGAAVMLVYGVASYAVLKRKMSTSVCARGRIYEAENIKSPFVLGLITPKIFLPVGLSGQEREYVVLHEQTHIRRHDHLIKFAAYFVLSLHWFNPLAWVAFLLTGVDMEMSCDERVLKEIGGETKKDYSLSLLSLAMKRRVSAGSPLAFSEGGIRARIKNVLNFKKTPGVIVIAAAALAALLSAGFALNKADSFEKPHIPYVYAISTSGESVSALTFSCTWNGGAVDTIAPWQCEFGTENTLFAPDGIISLHIGSDAIESGGVTLYTPDGEVIPYDGGSLIVLLPDNVEKCICVVDTKYSRDNLHASYGFLVVRNEADFAKSA